MVTIKGGVLKGGTTKKKEHYMDDRKPQQMAATGAGPGSKRVGKPKKLEGALGPSTSPKKAKSKSTPKGPTNTPKAKPSRSSKPMQASIPRAQGKSNENYLLGSPRSSSSVSISNETAIGRGINSVINYFTKGNTKKKKPKRLSEYEANKRNMGHR